MESQLFCKKKSDESPGFTMTTTITILYRGAPVQGGNLCYIFKNHYFDHDRRAGYVYVYIAGLLHMESPDFKYDVQGFNVMKSGYAL